MGSPSGTLRDLLVDTWERWALRCAELTPRQWATPTRCAPWDVQVLVAHVCPELTTFDTIAAAVVPGPPAVSDGAELLRRFNRPDGVAHTGAAELASRAMAEAADLTPDAAATRFRGAATRMSHAEVSATTAVSYPVVGSTTMAVIVHVALMEATVHLLDLAAAVGGVAPSAPALASTRDLLAAIPEPTALVEALTGRIPPTAVLPAVH